MSGGGKRVRVGGTTIVSDGIMPRYGMMMGKPSSDTRSVGANAVQAGVAAGNVGSS